MNEITPDKDTKLAKLSDNEPLIPHPLVEKYIDFVKKLNEKAEKK
jgi:hypothetical protein